MHRTTQLTWVALVGFGQFYDGMEVLLGFHDCRSAFADDAASRVRRDRHLQLVLVVVIGVVQVGVGGEATVAGGR